MVLSTADRANIEDNIVNAAKLIRKSPQRRAVFIAIYSGNKPWKTVSEIAKLAKLSNKRVVELVKPIVDHGFAGQRRVKADGENSYTRDRSLFPHRQKVLSAAADKKKLDAIPTRNRPQGRGGTNIFNIKGGKGTKQPRKITVDELATFCLTRKITTLDSSIRLKTFAESRVKEAFKNIIGESHDFKDWGGEKNDLYTNKLRVTSMRKDAAFAFKGRATQGTLTPAKMGKNGDQVGRLFSSDAEVFFVVYHSKVDESIHSLMYAHAVAKGIAGRTVLYGVIDGDDLNRIAQAYRKEFKI